VSESEHIMYRGQLGIAGVASKREPQRQAHYFCGWGKGRDTATAVHMVECGSLIGCDQPESWTHRRV